MSEWNAAVDECVKMLLELAESHEKDAADLPTESMDRLLNKHTVVALRIGADMLNDLKKGPT